MKNKVFLLLLAVIVFIGCTGTPKQPSANITNATVLKPIPVQPAIAPVQPATTPTPRTQPTPPARRPIIKNTTAAITPPPVQPPVNKPVTPPVQAIQKNLSPTPYPDTAPYNWNVYCSELGGDVQACKNTNEEGQIDTLLALINGTEASSVLGPGVASWMLSFYPPSEYQAFGCINETAVNIAGSWNWLTYTPPHIVAPNESDPTQFYWVNNTTTNLILPYEYNDSNNNTWNCSWISTGFNPIAEPPTIDCNNAALQDWNNYCNETGLDCGSPNQHIMDVLSTETNSVQWNCAHGGVGK